MRFSNDPFAEMSRLFEQTRRSMWNDPMGPRARTGRDEYTGFDAGVDVERTDEGYVVMADLPGFDRDDITIRFADGILSIEGETDVTEESEGGDADGSDGLTTWQRRGRSVHERVALPDDVVLDESTASYHNGVLEVYLPTETEGTDEYRIDID